MDAAQERIRVAHCRKLGAQERAAHCAELLTGYPGIADTAVDRWAEQGALSRDQLARQVAVAFRNFVLYSFDLDGGERLEQGGARAIAEWLEERVLIAQCQLPSLDAGAKARHDAAFTALIGINRALIRVEARRRKGQISDSKEIIPPPSPGTAGGGEGPERLTEAELVACIGLMEAVRKFDLHAENRLWTFAKYHIKNAFGEEERRKDGTGDDAHRHQRVITTAYHALREENGNRRPTVEEVFIRVNAGRARPIGKAAIAQVMERDGRRLFSLDETPTEIEAAAAETDDLTPDGKEMPYVPPPKFLVLYALRETEDFRLAWADIVNVLTNLPEHHPDMAGRWAYMRMHEFSRARLPVPATWAEAWAVMRPPPPLSEAALKQFLSRQMKKLSGLTQLAPRAVVAPENFPPSPSPERSV